jgi:hypothetical protein
VRSVRIKSHKIHRTTEPHTACLSFDLPSFSYLDTSTSVETSVLGHDDRVADVESNHGLSEVLRDRGEDGGVVEVGDGLDDGSRSLDGVSGL